MKFKFKSIPCLTLFLFLFCFSCQPNEIEDPLIAKSKDFYEAMNASDLIKLKALYLDSVRVLEGDFQSTYTFDDYSNWLAWDASFKPRYEVLEKKVIDENSVEVIVAKSCRRILFLNEEPLVSKEKLTFQDGKIFNLEIVEFLDFDNKKWEAKREKLVTWIKEKHPELDGFIYDQSEKGGADYIKALDLYEQEFND